MRKICFVKAGWRAAGSGYCVCVQRSVSASRSFSRSCVFLLTFSSVFSWTLSHDALRYHVNILSFSAVLPLSSSLWHHWAVVLSGANPQLHTYLHSSFVEMHCVRCRFRLRFSPSHTFLLLHACLLPYTLICSIPHTLFRKYPRSHMHFILSRTLALMQAVAFSHGCV